MGNFDKKRAFGIGGGLAVLASIIAVAANISEIIQLFRGNDKPESSTPARTQVVETVSEETVIEQADVIEAENIAEFVEEVPPTEPKPVSVYINDLQYMSCKNFVKEQNKLTDNVGNMYHKGLFMGDRPNGIDPYRYEGSADYYIQGKYTTFSGIVAVPNGNENDDRSAFFDIYGDGNLLYTSSIMTNTSFPESFSIDITDVQLLTISYPDSNTKSEMATIYDGVLST